MTTLFLLLLAFGKGGMAFAGGLECQINGTCQCQRERTCDKEGNPISPMAGDKYLYCEGSTQNFKVDLEVDPSNSSAKGVIYAGAFSEKFNYSKMRKVGACLRADFFKVCFPKSNAEAEIQIIVQAENDFPLETGVLRCTF